MAKSRLKPSTRKLRSELKKIKNDKMVSQGYSIYRGDKSKIRSAIASLHRARRAAYGKTGYRNLVKSGLERKANKAFEGTFRGGPSAHKKHQRYVKKAEAYKTK